MLGTTAIVTMLAVSAPGADKVFHERFRTLAAGPAGIHRIGQAGPGAGKQGVIRGLLDVKAVQATLAASDLRRCAKRSSGPSKMIIDMAIRRSGRVADIRITPPAVASGAMGQCILSKIGAISFPRFTGELKDGAVQPRINVAIAATAP